MRRHAPGALALALLAVALVAGVPGAALGATRGGPGCVYVPSTQEYFCPVDAHKDGVPAGATGGKRSKRTPTCYRTLENPVDHEHQVPCTSDLGVWVQEHQCYAKPRADQPADGSAMKEGHEGETLYDCVTDIPYYRNEVIWFRNPPQPRVDPELLAADAVELMQLRRVVIGMAPKPGPDGRGLVGLPTYMWVADPGPSTTGPQSRTATAGDVSVTATARVERIVWSMGDGTSVTCTGPGTPYQDSFGTAPSPTCGHQYLHPSTALPGGAYPVTATAYWHVDWVGGGEDGFFEFSFPSTTTVRIGEAQALN